MKYTCPHCGTAKEIDSSAIPPQGIDLQCFNCFNDFHVPFGIQDEEQSTEDTAESIQSSHKAVNSPSSDEHIFDRQRGFGFDLDDAPKLKNHSPFGRSMLAGEDLPQPVTNKKSALKTFKTPDLPQAAPSSKPLVPASTPIDPPPTVTPPMVMTPPPPVMTPPPPVMTPPPPVMTPPSTPELAASSTPPSSSPPAQLKSEELFAVQSTPAESPELYAVQSAPAESPELYAVQSAPAESPELYAVQSTPAESPELYAVQSAPAESPELQAVQSSTPSDYQLGDLDFGGLSDLFDQGEEDVDTLFDTSPQGKTSILQEKSEVEQGNSVQQAIFSTNDDFSLGGGFDFGVSRDFDYRQPVKANPVTSESNLEIDEELDPSSLSMESDEDNPLPIDASAIVFDMGEEEKDVETEEAVSNELMSIGLEDEHVEEEAEEQDINDLDDPDDEQDQTDDQETSSTDTQSKSSHKSLLWIALILIAIGGYLFTQNPSLVDPLLSQFNSSGDSTSSRGPENKQFGQSAQQRALGKSEETSSLLRNISQAAKGQTSRSTTPAKAESSSMTPSARTMVVKTPKNRSSETQKTETPKSTDKNLKKKSWFHLSQGLKSAFKFKDLEKTGAYADTINNPSPLDAEGFNNIIKKMQVNQKQKPVQTMETLSMGALHFNRPHTTWARDAHKMIDQLSPEATKSPDGERALTATHLVHQLDGAKEHAIALGLARPKDPAAQELMGYAYLKRGQTREAQSAFDRARKLDPSRVQAQQKFAELAIQNGDIPQAKSTLNRLIKDGYGSPVVHQELAEVNVREGETGKAFGWINNLFEAPPERFSKKEQAKTMSTFAQIMQSEIDQTRSKKQKRNESQEAMLINQEQAKLAALRMAIKKHPDDQHSLERLLDSSTTSNNWKLALQEVQNLQSKSNGSVSLALKEVELLKKLERSDKALNQLEKTLKEYPKDPRPQLMMGKELLQQREYTKARSAFERAQQLDPTNPEPTLALTDLLIKEARVKEAQSYLQKQIDRRPWSSSLHNGFGDIKLKIAQTSGQSKFYKQAKASYDRALDINPSNHKARAQRARTLLALGKPELAINDLKWLKNQNYIGDLNFEFGQAQQSLGQFEEAKNYYQKVLQQNREHLDALRSMGMIMQSTKKGAKAKQYYEQALAVNPRDSETRFAMGRLLLDEKDPQKAVEHFRIASEIKQQDPKLHYWYGRALESNGDQKDSTTLRAAYENAAALVKQDDQTSSDLCDIHFRVGVIHSQQPKELSLALDDFTKATKCAPKRPDVWSKLAGVYHKIGDQKAVMKHYRTALKNDPKYVPALMGTAREYLNQIPPKIKSAKRSLDRILKQNKRHPEAHYRYCTLYQTSSRRKAKRYCRRYLKLQPQGEFAESAKEIIRSL